MTPPTVSARARSREDRAGDPLDGLVNLFDLGIVLAVAFLLAALSSANLTPEILGKGATKPAQQGVAPGTVTAKPGDQVTSVQLQPGERVVGRGEKVGTLYRLDDGRTIVVREGEAPPTAAPSTP